METLDIDGQAAHVAAAMRQLGGGTPRRQAPVVRIHVGETLTVSCWLPSSAGHQRVESLAGQVTLAAHDADEARLIAWAARRFGHASAERFVSERGLVHLRQALADVRRVSVAPAGVRQVVERARAEPGSICAEAVRVFCGMLGSLAGDLALTVGALGGVYLDGPLPRRLGPLLAASPLRHRFEDKGRFKDDLAGMPMFVA